VFQYRQIDVNKLLVYIFSDISAPFYNDMDGEIYESATNHTKRRKVICMSSKRIFTHQFFCPKYPRCLKVPITEIRIGWTKLRDSVLSSPTSASSLLEWPCQEQRISGLTTSTPISDVSSPAYTNGVWPLLRHVRVAQKNKQGDDHVVLQCPIHRPPNGLA